MGRVSINLSLPVLAPVIMQTLGSCTSPSADAIFDVGNTSVTKKLCIAGDHTG